MQIEEASFRPAWGEEDFLRALRQRNCIAMVVEVVNPEIGEHVVGFMLYELHKNRLHLARLAVCPDYRLKGVGRKMVEKIISKLSSHRRNRVNLEVRETNLDAQLFFRAMGFEAVNVLHNYYEDTYEDAYRMVYRPKELACTPS